MSSTAQTYPALACGSLHLRGQPSRCWATLPWSTQRSIEQSIAAAAFMVGIDTFGRIA